MGELTRRTFLGWSAVGAAGVLVPTLVRPTGTTTVVFGSGRRSKALPEYCRYYATTFAGELVPCQPFAPPDRYPTIAGIQIWEDGRRVMFWRDRNNRVHRFAL